MYQKGELLVLMYQFYSRKTIKPQLIKSLTLHHNTCRAFPCDSQSSKVHTALDSLMWDMGRLLKCMQKSIIKMQVDKPRKHQAHIIVS